MTINSSSDKCLGLGVLDIQPHHRCYNWTKSAIECEAEWPCEARQYLVSILPLISLTNWILSYGTVIIIVVGLFLNILSFYTLVSSGLSKSGSGIYLVSLAVCDIGNLIANYAIGVARGNFPSFNAYFMKFEWLCRFHGVFVEVFQLISAWIVVSFTVERCIAIWYPIILRNTSRTRRAKTSIISLSTILTLFALSKLFLTGFESDSVFGYPPCPSKRHRWQGMAYLRVAFQTWIPTIIVFIFNCLMFHKLGQIKKKRKRLTEYKHKRPKPARDQTQRKPSFINRPSPTAPMLMAVSITYLVLVFPLGAIQSVELFWNVQRKVPIFGMANNELRHEYIHWKTTKLLLKYIRSLFFGFYQINFAINFFLYFAAGLQFRLHLQHKIIGLCKRWKVCYLCASCCEEDSQSVGTSLRTMSTSVASNSRARQSVNGNPSTSNPTDPQPNPKSNIADVCHISISNQPTSPTLTEAPTAYPLSTEADDDTIVECHAQPSPTSEIPSIIISECIPLEILPSQESQSNVIERLESVDVHKSECDSPQQDSE
ncbi:unnamed protein product [Orchesella dallaii]|uniref:G-protein coupled receptors family 1 profile domain-containing protein n=1 Tax=Orchesella dallaii TaxID=48710 RepID=A0ABP1QJY1_9HEXA